MSDKTLLDVALGTGDPEELTPEDLEHGIASGAISPMLISNMWQRISNTSQVNIMELLRQQERYDLPSELIPKMVHSKAWTKKIRIEVALWLLRQEHLSRDAATDTLQRGIYKTRGIPIERFFKTCMALRPHLSRWDLNEYLGNFGYATPLFALGWKNLPADPATAAAVPFREDAGKIFEAYSTTPLIRAIARSCVRRGEAAEKYYQLISRSVCPRAMLGSVLFGHPRIKEEHKVHIFTHLCNKDIVPLDNYLQLGTIPREMFTFDDLREHCRLSDHYVNEYHKNINP